MTDRPMRYQANRFRDPASLPAVDRSAIRAFHRSLPDYKPTPLHSLPGLAATLGLGRILVKDEGYRFGLKAFKGLGASWAVHRLQADGQLPFTLASATEGNHGRAVAWTARQLGLRAVIFMTARASSHRIEAIRREGAEVRLVDGTYELAVATCAAESAANGWQVVADVGYGDYLEIPRWITAGYSTILGEYEDQRAAANHPPADVVLAQAGVGGLAAAVVEHFHRQAHRSRVVIVEPVDADPLLESSLTPDGRPAESTGAQGTIMAGLNCSRVSESAWPVIRAGADLFLSVADHWALDAMRRYANPVAGDPIVVAGESGAAGLAGLLALVEHPPFADARRHLGLGSESTVLLIVTEGDTDPESWRRIASSRTPGKNGD